MLVKHLRRSNEMANPLEHAGEPLPLRTVVKQRTLEVYRTHELVEYTGDFRRESTREEHRLKSSRRLTF